MGFGIRGRHKHNQMILEDVTERITSDGKAYLQFNERQTKTRTGESRDNRIDPPKIFETRGKKLFTLAFFCNSYLMLCSVK